MICPKCGSSNTKKNGYTYRKKHKYQCNSCKYQFTEHSQLILGDELWSLVGSKDNQCWIWLALDSGTREIVGGYLGARDIALNLRAWLNTR